MTARHTATVVEMQRAFLTTLHVCLAVASVNIATLGSAGVVLCASQTGHIAIEASETG